jgi:amidase
VGFSSYARYAARVSALLTAPATRLVALVASGTLSAEDLVTLTFERIAACNPALNAFVELREDLARLEARRQDDAAARGVPRGPLGGLPVTVKSAIGVAGLRCEAGSPAREGLVAAEDAVTVARLRAAGALVVGTTNVAEMLMAYESDNPLYGRTGNPFDLSRTAGGSSGGEAAAIASGCSAAGLGSDGGGSVRVPAHFTGICALKPTPGRIPATGHDPACLGPFGLVGTIGPMARTVGDLALLYRVLAGWDDGDPAAMPAGPEVTPPGGAPARVAIFEDDGTRPVAPEVRAAVRGTAEALAEAGYDGVWFRPAAFARARALWEVFFAECGALLLHDVLQGGETALPILAAHARSRGDASSLTAHALVHAWVDRDVLRAELLREIAPYAAVIGPVAAVPAFRHGERAWSIDGVEVGYLDAMIYTQWGNVLGLPAVVVPVGRTGTGLPVGVQVMARPFDEPAALAVAAAVERATGGYRRPPEVAGR